jgi:hypothetical protein
MSTGDGGLELDLERDGASSGHGSAPPPKKKRDWKAIGMVTGKFLSGLAVTGVATWGALKPETKANETAENAKSAYSVSQEGIEKVSKELSEAKAALSVLTKRFSDHTEKYHKLDKRLIRAETILEMEEDFGDEDVSDEQLAMLAELDAIRRELEAAPPAEPPPTAKHKKPRPHIRQEGQQIRMPSPAELFE